MKPCSDTRPRGCPGRPSACLTPQPRGRHRSLSPQEPSFPARRPERSPGGAVSGPPGPRRAPSRAGGGSGTLAPRRRRAPENLRVRPRCPPPPSAAAGTGPGAGTEGDGEGALPGDGGGGGGNATLAATSLLRVSRIPTWVGGPAPCPGSGAAPAGILPPPPLPSRRGAGRNLCEGRRGTPRSRGRARTCVSAGAAAVPPGRGGPRHVQLRRRGCRHGSAEPSRAEPGRAAPRLPGRCSPRPPPPALRRRGRAGGATTTHTPTHTHPHTHTPAVPREPRALRRRPRSRGGRRKAAGGRCSGPAGAGAPPEPLPGPLRPRGTGQRPAATTAPRGLPPPAPAARPVLSEPHGPAPARPGRDAAPPRGAGQGGCPPPPAAPTAVPVPPPALPALPAAPPAACPCRLPLAARRAAGGAGWSHGSGVLIPDTLPAAHRAVVRPEPHLSYTCSVMVFEVAFIFTGNGN